MITKQEKGKQVSEFWHSKLMPHLESRRSCQEITCYRPHTHDKFSVGLVDAGNTVFSGASEEPIRLEAGNVILIPTGHVHACNPVDGQWRYQMIQADQDWIGPLLPTRTSKLLSDISVFQQPEIYHQFTLINELLFADADTNWLKAEFRQGFNLCTQHDAIHRYAAATDTELIDRLYPVLIRLREDESNPVLNELANIAGMSKYQLIRAMKQMTGLAPLAWRQNHRVTTARQMLRDGRSLVDTAHALGFVDQSHFHRVFLAHVAATPGTYRG